MGTDRAKGEAGKKGILKERLNEIDKDADYGGGFNKESGTWKAGKPKLEDEWQGRTKGGTKHTYGRGGDNLGTSRGIMKKMTESFTNNTYPEE